MKKISSEDCIDAIHKVLPHKTWRRVSKTTVIERIFKSEDGIEVLVREEGGNLTVLSAPCFRDVCFDVTLHGKQS
jgi:hypothetical protein